jgi:hypothetical protein
MKKAYASPGFSHGQLVSLLRLFFLGLLHSVFAILLWCNELGHHWPLLSSPNTPSIRFPARLDVESGRLPFSFCFLLCCLGGYFIKDLLYGRMVEAE